MITKTGIFSIVGRPNAGKSTLLNALCKTKVSIVSQKPQTTRTRITGIRNIDDCQLVFMDTPGLHKARNRLGDFMTRVIEDTVSDVDAAILIVEPVARIGIPEQILIDKIKAEKIPAVLVINKIDTIKEKEELLEVIRVYSEACEFCDVVPLSARNRDGVDALTKILCSMCIESPQLYPDDMLSDQPARAFAAELVREPFNLTEQMQTSVGRYDKLRSQDGYTVLFEYDRHVFVNADKAMILRVLYNLINNGINYAGEDKTVTVQIGRAHV